jgi:uncharacterized membrane protein YeiH
VTSSSAALLAGDLVGVAVFAASGASAGVAKRLDMFGVVFVGFVAALGGGIIRDLVIGTIPPLAFADWRYPVTAAAASLLVFCFHPHLDRLRRFILVLDAAGLALFTVTGTLKALHADVPAVGACLIGMISAIGGGVGRDMLTAEIPAVLRHEIYALASLIGTIAVAIMVRLSWESALTMTGAAILVFAIRIIALRRRWSAPTPRVG